MTGTRARGPVPGMLGPAALHARAAAIALAPLAALGAAQAHHSQSQFDLDPAAVETIAGRVTQFEFKNPHVYLYLETTEPDGSTALWELEASSTPNLIRRGWRADSIEAGEALTIDIHPARVRGRHIARIATIHFADGSTLAVRGDSGVPGPADTDARATSLAGRWLGRYGLAQLQLGLEQWPLTPKGRAAQQSFDILQNPQIDCIPIASPTFMLYSNLFDVTVAADRVVIDGEWMGVQRIVYLDGRAHPPPHELSLQGHSVGHWDDGTLVVETTNFAPHGVGNAFEVPSSPGKRLLERLTLSEDGKRIEYAFELEDPEYLTAPVTGTSAWDHRPDLEPQLVECDRENARRFLERMNPSE